MHNQITQIIGITYINQVTQMIVITKIIIIACMFESHK
jgi:hypothetical protein